MKKLILCLLLCLPTLTYAGDWYEDWDTETTYEITYVPYYYGYDMCTNYYWETLEYYVHPNDKFPLPFLYVVRLSNGQVVPTPDSGDRNACKIYLPHTGYDTIRTPKTRRVAIEPYPDNVDIERLGCTNQMRKFIINVGGTKDATSMKIYMGGSPAYPDTLIYSGAIHSNLLLNIYPPSDTTNLRVKLDAGSSFYTTLRNASCTGGGIPVPLD